MYSSHLRAPVFAGTRTSYNSQTPSCRIGLRSSGSNLQQVLVDNVSLDEGAAAVPEPVSVILLGLGGLALVRRRR